MKFFDRVRNLTGTKPWDGVPFDFITFEKLVELCLLQYDSEVLNMFSIESAILFVTIANVID